MSTNAEATPVPIALSDTHFRFDMSQVLAIEACGDMSLPEGAGMVLETTNGSFYMVGGGSSGEGNAHSVGLVVGKQTFFFKTQGRLSCFS